MAEKFESAPSAMPRRFVGQASALLSDLISDDAIDSRMVHTDLRAHLRRRLSIICERAGLDEERAKAWSIIREVQMGLWAIEDEDANGLTKAISIIKAMQPD